MAQLQLPDPPRLPEKPRAAKGERDPDALYLAVGRVLSAWEMLESALADLYSQLIEAGNYAAYRSYGWIQSPETRAQVLKEALELTTAHTHLTTWADRDVALQLVDAYRRGAMRRNHFAHGVVMGLHQEELGITHFLLPSSYSSSNNWSPVKVAHNVVKDYPRDDPFAVYGSRFRYDAAMIYEFMAYTQDLFTLARDLQMSAATAAREGAARFAAQEQARQAPQQKCPPGPKA